jgi:hypothetical protein
MLPAWANLLGKNMASFVYLLIAVMNEVHDEIKSCINSNLMFQVGSEFIFSSFFHKCKFKVPGEWKRCERLKQCFTEKLLAAETHNYHVLKEELKQF